MPASPSADALSCAPLVPLLTLSPLNIILFTPEEFSAAHAHTHTALTLPQTDARATHILGVLRRKPGDTFDAGLIDGPRGKATLAAILPATSAAHAGALSLTFAWDKTEPPPPPPITLIIGLPRPQTARKILNEATSLGVSEMRFVATERGEPSYAQSTLWTTGEYRRHLVAGAAQAFCTRIPRVTLGAPLDETLAALAAAQPHARRVALDNYESPDALSAHLRNLPPASAPLASSALPAPPAPPAPSAPPAPLILAFGSERGWTSAERNQLRAANFVFAHLGARVLRTETAVTAALTLALAHLGRM